jgi:hypothetical protein
MPEELYTKKEYESMIIKTLGDSPKLRIGRLLPSWCME